MSDLGTTKNTKGHEKQRIPGFLDKLLDHYKVRFTEDEWTRFVEKYLAPASENSTDKV